MWNYVEKYELIFTGEVLLPVLCIASDWLGHKNKKIASTNHKHFLDLGSDTSSAWSSSGVILQEN